MYTCLNVYFCAHILHKIYTSISRYKYVIYNYKWINMHTALTWNVLERQRRCPPGPQDRTGTCGRQEPRNAGGSCAVWPFRLSVRRSRHWLGSEQLTGGGRAGELQGWRRLRHWSCGRAPGSRLGTCGSRWRGVADRAGARMPLLSVAGPGSGGVGAGLRKSQWVPRRSARDCGRLHLHGGSPAWGDTAPGSWGQYDSVWSPSLLWECRVGSTQA